MTKRDLWSTGIKLYLTYSFLMIPILYLEMFRVYYDWFLMLICGIGIAVLVILAKLGDGIARLLIRHDQEIKITGIAEPAKEFLTLGLRIIGVIYMYLGVNKLAFIFLASDDEIKTAKIIADILCLVLGFYLLSGARLLVRFLSRRPAVPDYEPHTPNDSACEKEVANE